MVYGLPCRMLTDPQHCDTSLEAMADDYAATIRSLQPHGPYRLLGWSLGGTLAAMIAARLEKQAQEVSLLALVDPYIPGSGQTSEDDWWQDFAAFVSVILPSISSEIVTKSTHETPVRSQAKRNSPLCWNAYCRLMRPTDGKVMPLWVVKNWHGSSVWHAI